MRFLSSQCWFLRRTTFYCNANDYAASVRVHAINPFADDTVVLDKKETNMKTIQVYDKPMCCSTGVCGPKVDPVLPLRKRWWGRNETKNLVSLHRQLMPQSDSRRLGTPIVGRPN